jgi:hypothetical protein
MPTSTSESTNGSWARVSYAELQEIFDTSDTEIEVDEELTAALIPLDE